MNGCTNRKENFPNSRVMEFDDDNDDILDDCLDDEITNNQDAFRFGLLRRLKKNPVQVKARIRELNRLSLDNFNDDELLLALETAQVLSLSVKTLANWRWKGHGPKFTKIGGSIRYQVGELRNYLCSSIKQNTTKD